MNETILNFTGCFINRQQAMLFMQAMFEINQRPTQIFRGIIIMVEMYLYLSISGMTETRQGIQIIFLIFLLRIEKTVFEFVSLGIQVFISNFGILIQPALDSLACGGFICTTPIRLEVITDTKIYLPGWDSFHLECSLDLTTKVVRQPI
jgi:hypothetical protein